MASGTFTLYEKNFNILTINTIVNSDSVYCALVKSTYTPDNESDGDYRWADISSNEISEAGGYVSGGVKLTSLTGPAITNGYKFSSSNVQWLAVGGSIPAWRYAVFYISGTVDGVANPLIGYFIGDTTPADIPSTTVGNILELLTPANGWYTDTQT